MKLEEIRSKPTIIKWGRSYYIEVFDSDNMYITYPKGHIPIEESQRNYLKSVLNNISKENKKIEDSLYSTEIQIPFCPKLSRMCIKTINNYLKVTEGYTIVLNNKVDNNSIDLGNNTYISKEDYNKVISYYEASKYGDL